MESVTTKSIKTINENGTYHVALLDFGCNRSLVASLAEHGCKVTVLPAHTAPAEIAALGAQGIVLSNGPGDPAENIPLIDNLREIAKLGTPLFGVGLGHQLLALAMGARTEKLKCGHRGANQPVTAPGKNRTYITTQNHGYTVEPGSVDAATAEVSHVNANDGTVEGLRYKRIPCFTVQFHPEACGGSGDTEYLFDDFVDMMKGGRA